MKILIILEKNGQLGNGGNGDLCTATIQVQRIFCNSELDKNKDMRFCRYDDNMMTCIHDDMQLMIT